MKGYNRKSPQKRRYEMPKYAVPPKKKSGKERAPQPKNTVAMLNELRHGLIYKLESQTGPVHAPLFTISVEVDGQKYMGQGRSKKVARIEAAATALRSFIQFKDGAVLSPLKPAAPCGDARIFSPHENDTGVDKHPNRKARGQLRTKIESGEGTIPVKSSDGIQTWDGVLQGQRLLTMSCSDKIARWNIVGVQGSLLSSIIEPVYLHSIVLGSLLHPEHMYRAVCGRIEKSLQGLPPPYHLNKPRLALVTSAEPRNQAKAPNFGINWTIGDTELEVVNSLTGRTIGGQVSRITKQAFFEKFGFIMKNLPGITSRKVNKDYGETKADVKDYQTAKQELFSAFKREDLGSWLKKPIEQDQFGLAD
ncbi:hypothetical protein ACLKA6_004868 [Drosophila palustris]